MVAMARALMARPRLICMDEPTMGLSPLFVDRVLELIQTVNRQGVTIFMVEQNAHLALQIAHRGYVLQTGRIALSGPARDLLHDPQHPRRLSRRGRGGLSRRSIHPASFKEIPLAHNEAHMTATLESDIIDTRCRSGLRTHFGHCCAGSGPKPFAIPKAAIRHCSTRPIPAASRRPSAPPSRDASRS